MTEAIIFDCFGVLVTESWFPFKHKYFSKNEALATKAADLMDQSNAGIITFQQFIEELAAMAKLQPAEVEDALSNNVPNAALFDYIASELKPHYKIGMLSNASANWLTDMLNEGQLSLFDAIDLSYETGNTKPAEAAYRNLAEKLGVATESCVFIDDQPRYCRAAREVGMRTTEYHDFDQFKADLQNILDRS